MAGGNKKRIVCLRLLVFAHCRLIRYRLRISTSLSTILTHAGRHARTQARTHAHTHKLRGLLSFPRRMPEISHGHFLSQELRFDLRHITSVLNFWHRSFTFNSNNHQPDATVFQFIIPTFVYSSTCFGLFPAHHQELNGCSGSLWFYLRIVVIVVLCSWSGRPAGRIINGKIVASGW